MHRSPACVFSHRVRVLWGECDPAGILYFPRYFDYFHRTMESWFNDGLGQPYAGWIVGRKIGFPSVHSEGDFRAPSAYGDELVVEQTLAAVGRTSLTLVYRVYGADSDAELRAEGKTIVVAMDLDPSNPTYRKAIPVPDALRAAFAPSSTGHRDDGGAA